MNKKHFPVLSLKKQEIEDLRNGTFEIDCSKITLERQSPQNPLIYSGIGFVKQSPGGQFSLRLYSDQKATSFELLKSFSSKESIKAGQIIPEHKYFNFEAIDIYGRKWESKRFFLPIQSFNSHQGRIVISWKIRELAHKIESSTSINKARLNFKIFDKVDIPANTGTHSTKTIGEKEILKSWQLNAAKFESCGNEFLLITTAEMLTMEVTSDKNVFINNIEMRIIEALQFILARPIRWSILEKKEGKKEIVRIRPVNQENSMTRIHPPVNFPTVDHTGCAWQLYDKYLQYIIRSEKNDWHPLSSRIFQVFKASSHSFFTQALILCTEIEGILEEEFPNLGSPSKLTLSLIENAKEHINKWKIPKDSIQKNKDRIENLKSELSKLKERINGFLNSIKKSRAKDKLRALVESGAIFEKQFVAWDKLRPKLAHAYSPDSFDTQQFIDEYYKVLILFHHLIFYTIGYKGKYSDYSRQGWPIKEYPSK